MRRGLVLTGAGAYLAVVGLVTMQAMRGQSIVAPDALTLIIGATIAAASLAAALAVLAAGSRRGRTPGTAAGVNAGGESGS